MKNFKQSTKANTGALIVILICAMVGGSYLISQYFSTGSEHAAFTGIANTTGFANKTDIPQSFSYANITDKPIVERTIPFNNKIADITHADTSMHTLNLQAVLNETRNIVMVGLTGSRVSGTGYVLFFVNGGPFQTSTSWMGTLDWIPITDNTLYYKMGVANDDWDLYCGGYVVEEELT